MHSVVVRKDPKDPREPGPRGREGRPASDPPQENPDPGQSGVLVPARESAEHEAMAARASRRARRRGERPAQPGPGGEGEAAGRELLPMEDSQRALFPQRFRQMCVFGVVLVCAFYIIDIFYPWPKEVALGPRQFFGLRALWVAGYLMLLATSYVRDMDFQWQVLRDGLLVALGAGCIGVLCAHTGRMSSPYYGLLIILMLARFVLMPGAFWRVAPVSMFMLAVFLACACLWPSPYERPGLFGMKGITTLAFILGAMVPGLVAANVADRLALGLATAKLMGRYRLVRRLGSGGMGEVHLAYHASLRRPCAVKILKAGLGDTLAIARFEREAEAASRLRHPNTIAVFDFGRTDAGQPYYVMEYLAGCDIGQLVRRDGPLLPERCIYLLEQVAGSLAEAHTLGMIHRDVKPGNLFVTTMGGVGDFVKVLDFGLVKGVDLGPDLTRPDAFMGTPRYMAPEALCGQKVDCRVDVYALGCVAYFMLCGEPPFSSGDAYLDIYRQIHDPPPAIESRRDATLPRPSPEFIAAVRRCLEKDPRKRFSSAAELLMALEQTPEHGKWRPPPAAPSLDDQVELAPTDPLPRPVMESEARSKTKPGPGPGQQVEDEEESSEP